RTRFLPTKPGDRLPKIATGAAITSHIFYEGIFTPPSVQGTLMVPGIIGGMTWSGCAFDPTRSILVTNTNNLVAIARLIPRETYNDRSSRTEGGDYGDQLGAPYGLYRRFIQSPSH